MRERVDIAIVGGGLVGSALALSLKKTGLKMVLIEGHPPAPLPSTGWDARIYAMSQTSQRVLKQCGAWDRMNLDRVQPVAEMAIWGDEGAYLNFSAKEAGVPQLAWIVESRLMVDALWSGLNECAEIERICPAKCTALTPSPTHQTLTLDTGETLEARLVIGADGATSRIRQLAGIEVTPKPYGQKGVVANFQTEKPHGGIARQWFFKDGILAWLPLPDNQISIVWSCFDAQADALVQLNEEDFCEQVAAAGDHALGDLLPLTPAAAFPLRLFQPDTVIAPRLALVGDAAHTVHPLAGQGVNLGYQDVRDFSRLLSHAACSKTDVGDWALLRRYERMRFEEVRTMQTLCHALQKGFNNEWPVISQLRNWGLTLTNQLTPIKNALIRQALG